MGTIDLVGKDAPLWTCSVDGFEGQIFPVGPGTYYETHYILCQGTALIPAQHTITINPLFNSPNSVFWLDFIQFIPLTSDETQLDKQVLQIQDKDSSIVYDGQWNHDAVGVASQASEVGSSCQLTFNGMNCFPGSTPSLIELILFFACFRYLYRCVWNQYSRLANTKRCNLLSRWQSTNRLYFDSYERDER
jgi:hypothetical protein